MHAFCLPFGVYLQMPLLAAAQIFTTGAALYKIGELGGICVANIGVNASIGCGLSGKHWVSHPWRSSNAVVRIYEGRFTPHI